MTEKRYWIKERHNPQLGTYFVPMGQLSKREAMDESDSLYGDNVMLDFGTDAEYRIAILKLMQQGERVQP